MGTEQANESGVNLSPIKMFAAFVSKEAKHVLRDRRSLIILLGLPVVMMTLFGFALSNEVKNSNFIVIDRVPDATTIALTDRIAESQYFTFVGRVNSEDQVHDWFRRGDARLALVFPANFDQDLHHLGHAQVRLVADASDPNTASMVTNYGSSIVAQFQAEMAEAATSGAATAAGGIGVETCSCPA